MPDKLTDSEIVKALKSLEKDTNCGDCAVIKQCKGDCVFTKTLNLINRLQCERNKYRRKVQNQREEINRLQAENEKLFADNQKYLSVMLWGNKKNVKNLLNQIKAEAYKEFAERLKEKYSNQKLGQWNFEKAFIKNIDNLLKELVGEDK